jgi:hypothetical protein
MRYLYFIQSGADGRGPVKVGYAANVEARLATLQTGTPYKLYILAKIAFEDDNEAAKAEQTVHALLSASRMVGEWFEWSTDLREALWTLYGIDSVTTTDAYERSVRYHYLWDQMTKIGEGIFG